MSAFPEGGDTARVMPWTVHCDGSAMPNPGRIGLGAVMTAPDGTRHTLSQAPQDQGCNNEAEVRALMAALRQLQSLGVQAVRAYCDNSIVVEQVTGRAARPVPRLAALFDEARALLAAFAQVEVLWIPGHRNAEADALARAALGMAPRGLSKPRKKRP